MTDFTALPLLGETLRQLVTRAGLRPALEELGLGEDLDDLATEARPGAHFRLLQNLEQKTANTICNEAGPQWSRLCKDYWGKLAALLRALAQQVDFSLLSPQTVRQEFQELVTWPLAAEFLDQATQHLPGPPLQELIHTPFAAWLAWTGLSLNSIEAAIEVDERTFRRWREGSPIERLRPKRELLAKAGCHAPSEIATGWLMVAITLQTLGPEQRVRIEKLLHSRARWQDDAKAAFHSRAMHAEHHYPAGPADRLEMQLYAVFRTRPLDTIRATEMVKEMEEHALQTEEPIRSLSLSSVARFRARLAALSEQDEIAVRHYRSAFSGFWWKGGETLNHTLDEALIFCAGTANKVEAKYYWDMSYLLGTGPLPYRDLDHVELRRLSAAFEARFMPRRAAKERLTSATEIIDKPFTLSNEALSHPNRKKKFNNGETRRTPFMDAVMQGTTNDVSAILNAGGDVNVFIEETGESALSLALHRAQFKGTDIAYQILGVGEDIAQLPKRRRLSAESANRPFGVTRETPIKLAISCGDPGLIKRLAEYGADLEAPCGGAPTALSYAMGQFARSWIPGLWEQDQQAYLAGHGQPDMYDARRGAVATQDLAATRQAFLLPLLEKSSHRMLYKAFFEAMKPKPETTLAAIQALLEVGSNPNSRYLDSNGDSWSPTLFAAGIGHLPLFQLLLAHDGNPDLTLAEGSLVNRRDALWIASLRANNEIVNFLKKRFHYQD